MPLPPVPPAIRRAALVGRIHLLSDRHRHATRTTTTTLATMRRQQCGTGSGRPFTTSRQPPPGGVTPLKQKKASSLISAYTALLESRPLATKAVTSGVIALAGDITCQLLAVQIARRAEDESKAGSTEEDDNEDDQLLGNLDGNSAVSEIDWGRTLRFGVIGAALVAPALHVWYGVLLRTLPGTAPATVVKRVALDQLVFTPAFLALFLSSVMLLDGNAAKIEQKLRADYRTTLVTNWGVWMPAQVINFRFVPPVYQVLFANFVGYFWNVYLSYQSNKEVTKGSPDEESA